MRSVVNAINNAVSRRKAIACSFIVGSQDANILHELFGGGHHGGGNLSAICVPGDPDVHVMLLRGPFAKKSLFFAATCASSEAKEVVFQHSPGRPDNPSIATPTA